MKSKIVLALAFMAISTAIMAGCSPASKNPNQGSENTGIPENMEIANPWTESDKQGVAEATGFEMAAPDGASEVSYSYMSENGLAQMSYVSDGAKWTYRIQTADELTDISGISIEWSDKTEGNVAGREAIFYSYSNSSDETADEIKLATWYDMVTGVSYSLSVSGKELSGIDMQKYAENLYAPLQGDATDDPEKDRENELNDYFLGEHKRSYDESVLTISDNNDGTFKIDINIVRLANLENGIGTFEDHKMTFEIDDPSDNKISGVIYRDSDNSLTIKITDSTWEYLKNDDILSGFGK